MSLNKAMVIGRLGKDPEVRYLADGTATATLSVATSEKWKDKASGDTKEKTEWHRIVLFGKTAELADQYLQKGDLAYFEGKIQTRKWTNKEGNDVYTTEIRCDVMRFLSTKGEKDGGDDHAHQRGGDDAGHHSPPGNGAAQQKSAFRDGAGERPKGGSINDMDDDIPF